MIFDIFVISSGISLLFFAIFGVFSINRWKKMKILVKNQKKDLEFLIKEKNNLDFLENSLKKEINSAELRINDRISQMEIRVTNFLSKVNQEQSQANWELKEKIIMIEHQPTEPLPKMFTEARPRGRPKKMVSH